MDYLTVKETAELKGCSERYIQQLCSKGKINFSVENHALNRQSSYMIPLSALPENLQLKWYKQKRSDSGLLPESKEEKPKKQKKIPAPQRSFE